jgi:carboxylesterase
LHDEQSSPAQLRQLAQALHQGGMTVCAPLLPGHGRPDHEGPTILWRACYQEARQRFRLLKRASRHVNVVGVGFGAALAIHLARRESVASLALLAPAIVPRVTLVERLLLRLKMHRLRWLRPRMGWQVEILEAMEAARKQVSRLRVPIYACQCEDDERISPMSLRILQRRARHGASRFRIFPSGGHAILAAHGPGALHAEILSFLRGKH